MKRIISLLLIVTMLFTTFAINVSAATAEEFISEVALIYEDSVEDAKKPLKAQIGSSSSRISTPRQTI